MTVHCGAWWCTVVNSGVRWCNVVHSGAKRCYVVCGGVSAATAGTVAGVKMCVAVQARLV